LYYKFRGIENDVTYIDEKFNDIEIMDFEITFEAEEPGGVNLSLTYDYYEINKLMNID
jgi:hypothetical protein